MKNFLLVLVLCAWAVNVNARCFDFNKPDDSPTLCNINEAYNVINGPDNEQQALFKTYHAGYLDAVLDFINMANDYDNDLSDCVKCSPVLVSDIILDKYKKGDINGDADFTAQIFISVIERNENCKKRLNIQ